LFHLLAVGFDEGFVRDPAFAHLLREVPVFGVFHRVLPGVRAGWRLEVFVFVRYAGYAFGTSRGFFLALRAGGSAALPQFPRVRVGSRVGMVREAVQQKVYIKFGQIFIGVDKLFYFR
jgi:hypothetical protein